MVQPTGSGDDGLHFERLEDTGVIRSIDIPQQKAAVVWSCRNDDVMGPITSLISRFEPHQLSIALRNNCQKGAFTSRSQIGVSFQVILYLLSQMEGMQRINSEFYVDRSKVLGKGNYGVVYKGYNLTENRLIAVKFIDSKVLAKVPEYEREIQVMAELAKLQHPNIMGYYGFEKKEQGLYFFIEFCSGGSLKALVTKKMSQVKVYHLLTQLFNAMSYINKVKMIHRDLKPDNIMLDENQELKIADFGLARNVEVQMTKGACTPLYAAPEVLRLCPYDEKCDVWSAGLILYEMLTGREMFAHVKTKVQLQQEIALFGQPGKKIGYPKQLYSEWEKITLYMLTYDMKVRPTFTQLEAQFTKKYKPGIEKYLSDKYGYEAPEFDDGLRITKSISPYQPKKGLNVDIVQKLKEERSFENLNQARKFLTFFRMKNDMYTKLIREFTANVYGVLKNVHKYLLMFLSTCLYLSSLKENLDMVRLRRLITPKGEITKESIVALHEKEFHTLFADFALKHESSYAKFKQVLESQIIAKILGNYMNREEEKRIITQESDNALRLIEDANAGKIHPPKEYLALFNKIASKPDVFIKEGTLKEMSEGDVRTYVQIRIVINLNGIIDNACFTNDDYLRMKKQEIENKSKEELIEFIRPFNSLK